MKALLVLPVAALMLAACGEDKGAILATCRLERPGEFAVPLCMRAAGYAFNEERCGTPTFVSVNDAACYYATGIDGMIGEVTRGQ